MQAKKGSKLARSETLNIRFDPLTKWALGLAAARERRSIGGYVDWAVEQALRQCPVARDADGREVSALDVARECWHADPLQRLDAVAARYFDLLTVKERSIIQALLVLKADPQTAAPAAVYYAPEIWDALQRFADGLLSRDALSDVVKARIAARAA